MQGVVDGLQSVFTSDGCAPVHVGGIETMYAVDKKDNSIFCFLIYLCIVGDDSEAEIRIVETQTVNSAPRFATNMVPKDVVDLSDGRTVAEFAEEFQRAMALAGQSDSDSDDDTDDHR